MDNYVAIFILHALGDTIGFKNAEWEFNYYKVPDMDTINELIGEFIELGGVNGINLDGWTVSDDTLYHMSIAKALLEYDGKIGKKFINSVKYNLVKTNNRIHIDETKKSIKRMPGKTTVKYIQSFTMQDDGRTLPYDYLSGGNGAAMRCLCIGMAFHLEDELKVLVDVSIVTSKLTHNSPHGYLGGLTSAYFISLALQKVDVVLWPYKLVELLQSDMVKEHVDMKNNQIMMDYLMHIKFWKQYIDTRFVDEKPLKIKIFSNLIFRFKYYFLNFVRETMPQIKNYSVGGSGFCAMIMAYDSLLDCDGKWEKLIFYSMLHPGDSDTVGAIAGGLYGATYGFGDVPESMLKYLEEKKELMKLGEKYYDKFGKDLS